MNVPLEAAYREACLALGEALVIQRLQSAELLRLAAPPPEEEEPCPNTP